MTQLFYFSGTDGGKIAGTLMGNNALCVPNILSLGKLLLKKQKYLPQNLDHFIDFWKLSFSSNLTWLWLITKTNILLFIKKIPLIIYLPMSRLKIQPKTCKLNFHWQIQNFVLIFFCRLVVSIARTGGLPPIWRFSDPVFWGKIA